MGRFKKKMYTYLVEGAAVGRHLGQLTVDLEGRAPVGRGDGGEEFCLVQLVLRVVQREEEVWNDWHWNEEKKQRFYFIHWTVLYCSLIPENGGEKSNCVAFYLAYGRTDTIKTWRPDSVWELTAHPLKLTSMWFGRILVSLKLRVRFHETVMTHAPLRVWIRIHGSQCDHWHETALTPESYPFAVGAARHHCAPSRINGLWPQPARD